MKVVFEVTGCGDCPYNEHYVEQGMCGNFCSHPNAPKPLEAVRDGRPQECPLIDEDLIPVEITVGALGVKKTVSTNLLNKTAQIY